MREAKGEIRSFLGSLGTCLRDGAEFLVCFGVSFAIHSWMLPTNRGQFGLLSGFGTGSARLGNASPGCDLCQGAKMYRCGKLLDNPI